MGISILSSLTQICSVGAILTLGTLIMSLPEKVQGAVENKRKQQNKTRHL
jgi:hypothetical protein